MSKARKKGATNKKGKGTENDDDEPQYDEQNEAVADASEDPTAEEETDDVEIPPEVVKDIEHVPTDDDDIAVNTAAIKSEEEVLPVNDVVVANATAAAIEAAVVAAATTTTEQVSDGVVAAAAIVMQDGLVQPSDRDVILGEGSAGHKTNLLLQDMIRLHRILWHMHDKPKPTTASEIAPMVERIINIIKKGKSFELAGLKDVPKQFMKSTGRFLGIDKSTTTWKVLDDDEINGIMTDIILDEFKVDDLGPLTETPFSDLKDWITKNPVAPMLEVLPDPKDAILLPVDQEADKMYETQQGNKTLFHLASQLVTQHTNNPEKRVEAAISIMRGLDEALDSMGTSDPTTTLKARFLVRILREDRSVVWQLMDPASAAEFTVIFVFEVFLEKEIDKIYAAESAGIVVGDEIHDENSDANKSELIPVQEPTDHDVLFGRGGMTNSHPGNRRFRDIIALHRPDYIRAVKMDKPAVARKIVKAIRQGNPPGRFLKKEDDGFYYDVGDRTAAEKTSQGLRERTNAEKRQRSALREALRIRKQDMEEDDDENGEGGEKKAKTGDPVQTINYAGTNLPVPLSLNMKDVSTTKQNVVRSKKPRAEKMEHDELNCAGLPPNAVDEEGNILVTDHDILCGRGGLTNHHKGNKRFRDIVALHRPDYVRAPKIQKPSVARVIVRAIRNGDPPGRFLRKDEKSGKWIDIGDKKAAEKTSQALREKPSEELGKPGSLSSSVLPNPDSYLVGTVVPAAAPNVTVIAGASVSGQEENKEPSDVKKEDVEVEEV